MVVVSQCMLLLRAQSRANIIRVKHLHGHQVLRVGEVSPKNSTLDSSDVKHHSKLVKDWWNPNGPMRLLHRYNLIRVPFIRDGLVEDGTEQTLKPLKGKAILDIGCGAGVLSEPLARLGASVTGVDASVELIECAREHGSSNPALAGNVPEYIYTTIEEHAKTNENRYDGVVASEIIEHVANKPLFIEACVKTLKPGGRIFFTTPSRTKLAQFSVIFLAENVFKAIPKGTHQIEKFMTSTELSFLLERNNCHVEMISGIFYNIVADSFCWTKNQSFMFALQAIKCKTEVV